MNSLTFRPQASRPTSPRDDSYPATSEGANPPPADPAPPVPTDSTVPRFADVSHYQESIDWKKYAASGAKLAICKASQGIDWNDDTFAQNRASLKDQDLFCGIYHFAGLKKKLYTPKAEAEHYLEQVGKLGPKEFPVLDFESAYGKTPAQQVEWIGKWCAIVEHKTGKTPWVYSYANMINAWGAESLTKYPLWIADYRSSDPAHPPVTGSWPAATAWQYSEKSSFPGLPNCDASFLLVDPVKLPTLAGPAPKP